MRGSPLWQMLAVTVAFVMMGLPVWRLTRPAQAAPVPVAAAEGGDKTANGGAAGNVTLGVEADFAPAPAEFVLSYLGKAILQGKARGTATGDWKVAFPADGADLVLHAAWPVAGTGAEGKPGTAAARVVVSFPDGRQVEKSFWSADGATLDTVLSVPGKIE